DLAREAWRAQARPHFRSPADDAQAVAPRRRRLDFAVGATLVAKPLARKRALTSGWPADEAQAVAPRRRRLDFAVGATLVVKPFARKRAPRLTARRRCRVEAAAGPPFCTTACRLSAATATRSRCSM